MKSTADKCEHSQNTTSRMEDTQCLDNSDNTVEIKGQTDKAADDDTTQVKSQNVTGVASEVKGQHDALASNEENGVVSSQEGGSSANGSTVPNGIANGHLLMMEQHRCNGLNDTSGSSRRVLANVLTQHPPSSVVIELKDLTHIENGRLLGGEKNHLPSTSALPPRSPPLVSGERETSTVLDNPSKTHSEPILANRTQPENGSSSGANRDNSHKTSVLLVEAMAEGPTHHTEAESCSHKDKLNSEMTHSIENGDTGGRLPLGVDGLPCSLDPIQKRVRELELKHRREVAELRISLKEVQLQVHVLHL